MYIKHETGIKLRLDNDDQLIGAAAHEKMICLVFWPLAEDPSSCCGACAPRQGPAPSTCSSKPACFQQQEHNSMAQQKLRAYLPCLQPNAATILKRRWSISAHVHSSQARRSCRMAHIHMICALWQAAQACHFCLHVPLKEQ